MVAEEDLKEFYRCMLTVSEDKDGLAVEGLRFESIALWDIDILLIVLEKMREEDV